MRSERGGWCYAPRPGLATTALVLGWAVAALLGLCAFVVWGFAGPWDPDDLSPAMWRAQAEGYRSAEQTALWLLTPLAAAAVVSAAGGAWRRWSAPLLFAVGVAVPTALLGFAVVLGTDDAVAAALARADAPPPSTVESSPPPTPVFTPAVASQAVVDGVRRSVAASVAPVTGVGGSAVDLAAVAPVSTACAAGTAFSLSFEFRTGDDVASEEAILAAWEADGFTRDRAAGTNLLYGPPDSPVERAQLRGTSQGGLRLVIDSRCAVG